MNKFYAPEVVFFGLIVMYFAYKTGSTGGEIHHSEIISGAAKDNTIQDQKNTSKTNSNPAETVNEEEEENE